MEKLFIPIVLGTAREGRISERVALFLVEHIGKHKTIETELVDVRAHGYVATIPPWGKGGVDEEPTEWKRIAERADGFLLVVPEYNRGYPGELKLLLDSLHDAYDKKPVLVCGVSSGIFGGRALVEHMRPVLSELKMVPLRGGIYVTSAKETFDEAGNALDPAFAKRVNGKIEELVWFAQALKTART
ncbi:MAG TPA: NADPH-dependent FMN reductase [Candidatus Paceibacterota bacterium]|jgi:NAD(P)H-dependent FMN reductase